MKLPYLASQEELKAAYRRLCMLYHPDKHRDPELKRQAEQLFNLLHQAYEVLSDPQTRAIYDIYGKRGLEMEGWEEYCTVSFSRANIEQLAVAFQRAKQIGNLGGKKTTTTFHYKMTCCCQENKERFVADKRSFENRAFNKLDLRLKRQERAGFVPPHRSRIRSSDDDGDKTRGEAFAERLRNGLLAGGIQSASPGINSELYWDNAL
uniref:Uncharacterized protein n=1 Tax=Sphaerodactylus townsendi TaxID=933632 RepID=A0ACB8EDG2_9SAUR